MFNAFSAAADSSFEDSDKSARMRAAVRAYFRSVAAGCTPTRWELLCHYPDLAEELEQFLADIGRGSYRRRAS